MKFLITLILIFLPAAGLAQALPEIDLVWEADTYTPSWYAGRPLPSAGSKVTILALARQGNNQIVSNYDFRWEKDGKQIISASGTGANILTFQTGPAGSFHRVTLALHDISGKRLSTKTVNIPVVEPRLLFYREESWGIDQARAIGNNLTLIGPETKIIAEPFYFSSAAVANRGLNFDWRLEGGSLPANTEDPRRFALLLPDPLPQAARATLELRVVNLSESLQKATKSILATYGN